MKVVAITGERQAAIVDREEPRVAGSFVKVKIHAAPMCTECQWYRDGIVSDCLGHEAAGEVVEAAQGGTAAVGDRVIVMPQYGCGKCALCLSGEHIHCPSQVDPYALCNCETGRATFAQYCIQQDWLLVSIPQDLSYDHASMGCCGLGPTFNAMQRMQVNALDTVLVSGLGAVGLGAVVNAVVRGGRVLALESDPYRTELARSIGAEAVIDPGDPDKLEKVLALTGGRGADKSVEASSADEALAFLIEATRARGQIASVGWGGPMLAKKIVAKGLTVHGVWHWNHLRDMDAMLNTIRKAKPMLDKTITHTFPLEQVEQAWALQLAGQCGKIILHPWEA